MLVAVSFIIRDWSVLLASFAVGLTFAWKKISVDTMVQEALPDGYRGRVFSVYDVVYNLARVVAAALAIPMIPRLGRRRHRSRRWASCSSCGRRSFGRWFGQEPELSIRFYAGGRADEEPRSIVWGGVEEPVELVRTWREERDGERRLAFRLALADGTELDVSRSEPDGPWRLDREGDRARSRRSSGRVSCPTIRRTRAPVDERTKRNALIVGADRRWRSSRSAPEP